VIPLGVSSPQLSVGLARADPLAIGTQLEELIQAGVRVVHFDIMDGRFAGPLSGGAGLVGALPGGLAADVHLMVEDPERHVEPFIAAGAEAITFHPEATPHPHRLLRRLGREGVVRGLALSPSTPLTTLEPLLGEIELVLVLAVNPGATGEALHGPSARRVHQVRELVGHGGPRIAIDGGITDDNLPEIAALGPDLVVAGSAVFAGTSPGRTATRMLSVLQASAADPRLEGRI
jgi:ribulose-phosphate 3-epimerase